MIPSPTISPELRASFSEVFASQLFQPDYLPLAQENLLSWVADREAKAHGLGYSEGCADEAIRCHEHCEKARQEERAKLRVKLSNILFTCATFDRMEEKTRNLVDALLSHPKLSEGKMEGV